MVAIPFIYFTILSFILYFRHKKIDLACYTTIIYAVSGFFSILIDFYKLRYFDVLYYKISFEATFLYCFLITLLLIPIIHYSDAKIKKIKPIKNTKVLKFIAWIFGVYFIIFTVLSFSSIITVFRGDMKEIRNTLYLGEYNSGWMGNLNPIIRIPFSFMNLLLGCPWIPLLLAFYSYFIQKLSIKYFILLLLGSLLGPIKCIISVDRSGMAYYIIALGACYLIFSSFMTKYQKKKLTIILLILVISIIFYLSILTNSRFEDTDGGQLSGSIASIIQYFGQSFIHFCYYFEVFKTPEPTLQLIFPFTHQYILGIGFDGAVMLQNHLTLITGKFTGVFYTFLGHISMSAGNIVMIIYVITIFILSLFILNRNSKSEVNIKDLFFYFFFASQIFLGVFTHYYAFGDKTFSVIAFLIILSYLTNKHK